MRNKKNYFSLIAAIDNQNGVGFKGSKPIPWHLPADIKWFKTTTTTSDDKTIQNAVIMGKNTWLSLPEKFRPLKNRLNVVLSTNKEFYETLSTQKNVEHYFTLNDALASLITRQVVKQINKVFVIGGGSLYTTTIKHTLCRFIYLTEIDECFSCDVFFPEYKNDFKQIKVFHEGVDNGISYRLSLYEKLI